MRLKPWVKQAGGRKAGTLGDVSFFSLGRGKAFSVVEGGVILTDRDDLAEALNRLVDNLPRYGLLPRLKLIFMATALMLLMHPRLFWMPRSIAVPQAWGDAIRDRFSHPEDVFVSGRADEKLAAKTRETAGNSKEKRESLD